MSATGYGVFRRGPLQLALPLAALREVVPCAGLSALPCAAPCVVGGLDLRGTVLPVIDLGRLINAADAPSAGAGNIVVMLSEGQLLGLMADTVTGIFECEQSGLSRLSQAAGEPSLLSGAFRRPDDASLVSVLSVDALASLPGVPRVIDPRGETAPAAAGHAEAAVHLILVRTGDLSFALPSVHVQATLLDPPLQASPLRAGCCHGVIEHAGRKIPALDLAAFCGFDALPAQRLRQALVLDLERGQVAMLIEEVVDVVRTDLACTAGTSRAALPEADLFAGVLSLEVLPAHPVRAVTRQKGFYLLLDDTRLIGHPMLQGLAALNTPVAGATDRRESDGRAAQPAQRVITYDIGVEVASPIEQIAEILPWCPDEALGSAAAGRAALVVSRGRSIPTWCLSSIFGRPVPPLSPSASVLVVEHEGALVGFSVSRLVSIDQAQPPRGEGRKASAAAGLHAFDHRMVGGADDARMISLMDLQRIAASLEAA